VRPDHSTARPWNYTSTSLRRLAAVLAAVQLLVAGVSLAAGTRSGDVNGRPTRSAVPVNRTTSQPTTGSATRSVTLVNQTWTCDRPQNLDSVSVTISGIAVRMDAVKLESGCSGRIGRLSVMTDDADGVKVAEGAHDLVVEGGSIRCLAKLPVLHQDGIQVMGGSRITFKDLAVDCGRAGDTKINSNLFINMAGTSTSPPTDVACDSCTFGGGAAHTVLIGKSVRSGVVNSILCQGKFRNLTLTIGRDALAPLNNGNRITLCP
jgi:FlaG/FlaF family flagellin (archaellin)